MTADIFPLHAALASRVEEARRRAMLLHPSSFTPARSPESDPAAIAEQLTTRFERLHEHLKSQGLPDEEARTEVARIAAREVWDGFAALLRHHRAAGHQMDANVLAVALNSLRGLDLPLARHPGDVTYASRAVSTARLRLQHNGGLLHRLHPHRNPAFNDADATFASLEIFLARPPAKAA